MNKKQLEMFGLVAFIVVALGSMYFIGGSDDDSSSEKVSSSSVKKVAPKKSAKELMKERVQKKYTKAYAINEALHDDFEFRSDVMFVNPKTKRLAILRKKTKELLELPYETNKQPSGTEESNWNQFTYKGVVYDWQDQIDGSDDSIVIGADNEHNGLNIGTKKTIAEGIDVVYEAE
jgi:hypothetical protein